MLSGARRHSACGIWVQSLFPDGQVSLSTKMENREYYTRIMKGN